MEMKIKNEIVLDIETTGLSPYEHQITCICAYNRNTKEEFKECYNDERTVLLNFLQWLYRYDHKETLLITANGEGFDIPFIFVRTALLNSKNYKFFGNLKEDFKIIEYLIFDLINHITDKRISLNNLAKLYGFKPKSYSGLAAIGWYKAGKYDWIKNYCWTDVLLTEKIYLKYRELKQN